MLITVVGTLGKVAIATHEDTKSIFSCKSTIIRPKNINPFYLLTYLNSDTGKIFSLRGKRGVIQEGLNLTDLREIQVLIPSEKFQQKIEELIKKSFANIKSSGTAYTQAQTFLLCELGLADWQPKHQLAFVKNYSDTKQACRIDAEYFQPKYEEIIKAIHSYSGGWDTLGNLVSVKKCVEVGSGEYLEEGIPFEITEERTVLPIPSEEKQTRIQQKVIESLNLRKQSKHLLECAKRTVEIAIEKDERTAITWLENETGEM